MPRGQTQREWQCRHRVTTSHLPFWQPATSAAASRVAASLSGIDAEYDRHCTEVEVAADRLLARASAYPPLAHASAA